jgi:hypothetical protein
MRRRLLPASCLLLVIGLAGCAHQSAGGGGGYAGSAFGDCEVGQDCYNPDTTRYTCVFFEAPAMPARLAITGNRHHGSPRVVDRGWTPGSPPMDSSGSASASMSAASAAPPPIAREPVVVASPGAPRTPN